MQALATLKSRLSAWKLCMFAGQQVAANVLASFARLPTKSLVARSLFFAVFIVHAKPSGWPDDRKPPVALDYFH